MLFQPVVYNLIIFYSENEHWRFEAHFIENNKTLVLIPYVFRQPTTILIRRRILNVCFFFSLSISKQVSKENLRIYASKS